MKTVALTIFLVALGASARPPVIELNSLPAGELFTVSNGRLDADGPLLRWTIPRGQTSTLAVAADHSVLQHIREYDRLLFDYRIAGGRIQFMFNVDAFGIRSGPRQGKAYQWHIGLPTTTGGVWQTTQVRFDLPAWMPWNNKDGEPAERALSLSVGAASEDLVIELRDMLLIPDRLYLKPWWLPPVSFPVAANGGYRLTHQLASLGPGKSQVRIEIRSRHEHFEVTAEPQRVALAPFATQAIEIVAKQRQANAPPLQREDLIIAFVPEDEPRAAYLAQQWLVTPLQHGGPQQVVYARDDLARLRGMLDQPEVRKWLRYEARQQRADWFLKVRLDGIPGTSAWSHTAAGASRCPTGCGGNLHCADFMPGVVCAKCGHHEAGTTAAAATWKYWLGSNTNGEGGLDDLGTLYLLTGDEKYAQKGIELLQLYAAHYAKLPWTPIHNDAPYHRGDYILAASRLAGSSTYGSNFLLKGHFRLLNMICESPSWTDDARQAVYDGFVLPAFAELAKFPGGLFNMTDITNYDLLLAGFSCNDANILFRGLGWQSGLERRLTDIKPDGFSSEGRPLNYHYASMQEYITSVPLVRNAGLDTALPLAALKAAVGMPYQRATLSGYVPITGDNGCGGSVRPMALCDVVFDLFPTEHWLYEAGQISTLGTFLESLAHGSPEPDAWRKLLRREPTLFEHAGFAILRSGETAEEQVYVTLDYGENPMHAALDRLQITLWAYGQVFSQGPGSSYNAPSNFARGDAKAMAFICHGSLGNNVVMVDAADQAPAIGQLIAWDATAGAQFVIAEVTGHYPGVTHRRALVLLNRAVVMLDDLRSEAEHTYDFVYHNAGQLSASDGATPPAEPLGDAANYGNIRDLMKLADAGDINLRWQLPDGIALAFWQGRSSGDAYTGLTGMNNWATQKIGDDTPSVFVRARGKRQQFATVLQPLKGDAQPVAVAAVDDGDSFGVRLAFPGGVRTVLWRPTMAGKPALTVK